MSEYLPHRSSLNRQQEETASILEVSFFGFSEAQSSIVFTIKISLFMFLFIKAAFKTTRPPAQP